jgi:hypothetical protein
MDGFKKEMRRAPSIFSATPALTPAGIETLQGLVRGKTYLSKNVCST